MASLNEAVEKEELKKKSRARDEDEEPLLSVSFSLCIGLWDTVI